MAMIEGRDYAVASTVGTRARQEDNWGILVQPPSLEDGARLLGVVADGIGGAPAGDLASDLAVRTFVDSYSAIHRPFRDRLRHALAHANREVGIAGETDPTLAGMGTTMVAALFLGDVCEWLSVGDSLILQYRGGRLRRINPLHVYGNVLDELFRSGELTPEAAASDPDRAALTSAVQGTVIEDVAQGRLELAREDVLVLATDGLATLGAKEVVAICDEASDHCGAEGIANTLIGRIDDLALERQDNATVLVVRQSGTA